MTDYMEITEALEISRTAADLGDRATCIEGLERLQARLLGAGSDECEDCGVEIPQQRRAAVPWATRCAPCQTAREGRRP